jgi:predicted nucleotidyltransferase
MEDPEYPERTMYVHVTPAKIRSALRYVTENKGKTVKMPSGREYRVWSETLEREVSHLRYNVDEADLDAAVADELLQIVAYGTIIFG